MREENDSKPRVVLDTNILLSALGFEGRYTYPLRELVKNRRIRAFASPFILEELDRNLVRKAGYTPAQAGELIVKAKESLEIIEPPITLSVIKRKDSDNRILECALEARADALITGNMKGLLPLKEFRGIKILSPREFLDEFLGQERGPARLGLFAVLGDLVGQLVGFGQPEVELFFGLGFDPGVIDALDRYFSGTKDAFTVLIKGAVVSENLLQNAIKTKSEVPGFEFSLCTMEISDI